jgi:hypothetical protein
MIRCGRGGCGVTAAHDEPHGGVCLDCRVRILPPEGGWQFYMVHDHVWAASGVARNGGQLCVPCLQARIGRLLTGRVSRW